MTRQAECRQMKEKESTDKGKPRNRTRGTNEQFPYTPGTITHDTMLKARQKWHLSCCHLSLYPKLLQFI